MIDRRAALAIPPRRRFQAARTAENNDDRNHAANS
jgi:hypothetical protein